MSPAETIIMLRAALQAAAEHLDYCGYGDKWERECAQAAGIEKQINEALGATDPENETIAEAAVDYKDIGVLSVPRPMRHHHVMWMRLMMDGKGTKGNDVQGFVTNTGRFVGREEALAIATKTGQIIHKHGSPSQLFSEDCWETPPEAVPYRITNSEEEGAA